MNSSSYVRPNFQALTVHYQRRLVNKLKEQNAETIRDIGDAPDDEFLETPPSDSSPAHEIDATAAERVGRALLYPAPGQGEESDWYVFWASRSQTSDKGQVFEFAGLLKRTSSSRVIVEKSFVYLLERFADEDGLKTYTDHLDKGTLTRRGLFKTLLESDEGLLLKRRLIITPQPKALIRSLAHDASAAGSFNILKLTVPND